MDILDINIKDWMEENPGENPTFFFKKMNYYSIDELKEIYVNLYNKPVKGKNANNFNWIWKKINSKEVNIDPKYTIITDLEKENSLYRKEISCLTIQIKKLENKLKKNIKQNRMK